MSYCTPCPPCDTNFPLLCEPLETTASGKRLVVEDSAACQKTIQSPVAQQVLKTDGAGNLTWTNGANNTVLGKDSAGKVEFVSSVNNILQSGQVDLGSQPLTTTGLVNCKSINVNGNTTAGFIEVSGTNNAYIDLKIPTSDDFDLRILTSGSSGSIQTGNNQNIILNPGTGNVGVGTASPTQKLHVAGSFICDNNIKGNSLDIANTTGQGFIELSGTTGAYIDLKSPISDDYDLRILTNGTNSAIRSNAISLEPTTVLQISNVPTYADNTAAVTGGLAVNSVYKTATGDLRIVY
jgi:hypothetical protein